jgi:hypothetical protein
MVLKILEVTGNFISESLPTAVQAKKLNGTPTRITRIFLLDADYCSDIWRFSGCSKFVD